MNLFKYWCLASRPKTLMAGLSPVLIGTSLAFNDVSSINLVVLSFIILAVLFIQIGTNFANDYYDHLNGADTTIRLGPTRFSQSGLITPSHMKYGFMLSFLVAAFSGIYLIYVGGIYIFIIGLLSIVFGFLYTGGPYPLGYHGLGDLLVCVFFGPVAVSGTYFLLVGDFDTKLLIYGLCPGLLATALLVVNNYRDCHEDSLTGKRTLVVRFGENFGKWQYVFCVILSLYLGFVYHMTISYGHFFYLFILVCFSFMCCRHIFIYKGRQLNQLLAQTSILLSLFTLFFCLRWLI